MKAKILTAALAVMLGVGVVAAAPASAETISATTCVMVDYKVTNETTVVFSIDPSPSAGCPWMGVAIVTGSPTWVFTPGEAYAPKHWQQAVARSSADATCEDGWTPSWAQWPNDGAGGYTCERDIIWADDPASMGRLAITVHGQDDFAVNLGSDQFVLGCNQGFYTWPQVTNCP